MFSTKTQKILIAIFSLLTICLLAFFGLEIAYNKKIYLRTNIADISFAGLTIPEAENLLQEKINTFQSAPLDFLYEDGIYVYDLNDLDIKYDVAATISDAYTSTNILKKIHSIFVGRSIPLQYEISDEAITKIIDDLEDEISITNAKNANLVFEKDKIIEIAEKEGIAIDRAKLRDTLNSQIRNLSHATNNTIETIADHPVITTKDLAKPKQQAYDILNSEINLTYDEQTFAIEKTDLREWVGFSITTSSEPAIVISLNSKKIEAFLMPLVAQINEEPINAKLQMKNGKADVFTVSKNGIKLLVEESINKIQQEILAGETSIILATEEVAPAVTTNDIDTLGITELLAHGTSDFSGSPTNRRTNIAVGSEKFNGLLIEPGEEFSFNKNVGDVGPQTGFVPELVIKNGKTIPEYGGGLCQVSTTLFRATLLAGLPITERYAHAYPVRYYNPQGSDATVYSPHPDLRFINDTPSYILIQTYIEGNELFFDLYGTTDGRIVELDGPHQYDQQTNGAMKAVLYQNVYHNDELIRKDSFYSNYQSPALFPHPTVEEKKEE